MRIAIVSPPYWTMNAARVHEPQIPLGLLAVGGPLIDAGHPVHLVDADAERLDLDGLADRVRGLAPQVVLLGHAGSTAAHAVTLAAARRVKAVCPTATLIYGGVHATFHADAVLRQHPVIDLVVRGEGEAAAVALVTALAAGRNPAGLPAISGRRDGAVVHGPEAAPIPRLDDYRVGWELITDWDRYHCWGQGRAAIIQFSRGCPHRCTYCGQTAFWRRWRHRDPVRLADEIAALVYDHGIRFVNIADENPAASKRQWRRLLEEIAARDLDLALFATIRADDIVRDADLLPLYRRAGFVCVLLGIDSVDAATLTAIRKGSAVATDRAAIDLLRRHGILSMVGGIVGFTEETPASLRRSFRQFCLYDGDLLNLMHATPHDWTAFGAAAQARGLITDDPTLWDYRHPVLANRAIGPRLFYLATKLMEAAYHLRPVGLVRRLWHADRRLRRQLRWCYGHATAVWWQEVTGDLRAGRWRPQQTAWPSDAKGDGDATATACGRQANAAKAAEDPA